MSGAPLTFPSTFIALGRLLGAALGVVGGLGASLTAGANGPVRILIVAVLVGWIDHAGRHVAADEALAPNLGRKAA